jgi:putative endonuclease
MGGATSYHAGLAAEAQAADHYRRAGHAVMESRWRGPGGEIDLILSDGEDLIFVEVKKARDHATALSRVSPRQIARIEASAAAYAAQQPRGLLTGIRIDVAMVDAAGRVAILPNATMH